jgi:VWFA-related protein
VLLLFAGVSCVSAQNQEPRPAVVVRSNLVLVPAFAAGRDGNAVFDLTAGDFLLTDNGAPQTIVIEEETDAQPLALAIVVETGGAGADHLTDYQTLDSHIEALIGNVRHQVAVIGSDSAPHIVSPFSSDADAASRALAMLSAGDQGAAILDAVGFAVGQLREQPPEYRRAILLLSETVDQGSETTLEEALRLVSDTNTTIYSFAFSSTRSTLAHEAPKFSNKTPGPAHGCFSRDGADPEYDGHYKKQVFDCISQLAPPIRLVTMAFLAGRSALRKNTAESIAQMTGGEFRRFHDAKDLKKGLFEVSNDVPNYYVLSFRPSDPTPGLHVLRVTARAPQIAVRARSQYWIDDAK